MSLLRVVFSLDEFSSDDASKIEEKQKAPNKKVIFDKNHRLYTSIHMTCVTTQQKT